MLRAFILGMREFRSDLTTSYDDDRMEAYDAEREFAHRATGRRYDNAW